MIPPYASYVVQDLGTLGGASAAANAINDVGQVVGESWTKNNLTTHAFLWDKGVMTDLGVLQPHDWSTASDINEAAIVVGYSGSGPRVQLVGPFRGFSWNNGSLTDLGTLPGDTSSWAWGINDAGTIVGTSALTTATNPAHFRPYVYSNGVMVQVGFVAPGQDGLVNGEAFDINNSGLIVGGGVTLKSSGLSRAFSFDGAILRDLGSLGHQSEARAVNEAGRAVGQAAPDAMWVDTIKPLEDLGTLGGFLSAAYDVNDIGDVVGWSQVATQPSSVADHAFITRGCWMFDLNNLLPATAAWELLFACGINNQGQIVGWGLHQGNVRAFLLTPNGPRQ